MLNKILENFLAAPFRLILLFLAFLFLHQFLTKQDLRIYNHHFFLKRIPVYGAIVLIMMFFLIQLGMYSIFSLLMVIIVIMVFSYINHRAIILPHKKSIFIRKRALITFFWLAENRGVGPKHQFKNNIRFFMPKRINWHFFTMIGIGVLAVVARIAFMENDVYTLSGFWIKSLEITKNFDKNNWLGSGYGVVGEMAAINLYSTVVGVSKEMAIYTFGLIENFLLCTIIFYFVGAITYSKYLTSILGSLSFAVLFAFLPLNINTLFLHSPLYFALFFALSFMLFVLKPKLLEGFEKKYFYIQLVLVTAIALINFYTVFVLLPLFLLPAILFGLRTNKKTSLQSLIAYLIATLFIVGLKLSFGYINGADMYSFLYGNLLILESYSYFPQLIVPVSELLFYYKMMGWFSLGLVFFHVKSMGQNNRPKVIFTVYYLFLVYFNNLGFKWIDEDLFYQALTVLTPIQLGVFVAILLDLGQVVRIFSRPFSHLVTILLLGGYCLLLISSTNNVFGQKYKKTDSLKKDILKVYDELYTYQFKNSFQVVNNVYGEKLSGNEHFFEDYERFIKSYLEKDRTYQLIRNDKVLIKENPQFILSESVFVFLTDTIVKMEENKHLRTSPVHYAKSINVLDSLKGRGREVNLYYDSDNLKVYEIVNSKNRSNLNKMIFDNDR